MVKKKEKDVELNNKIIINPTLDEEAKGSVVISFGRFNPPTIGHEKLVNKVKEIARREGAKAEVYLSHSQDKKKNPLSYDDKVLLAREAFGPVVKRSNSKTLIDIMKSLGGRFKNVILVAGQDRVAEFEKLLNTYNGKEYSFDSIRVVSAGERDPDSEGVEGMSASKMREAALKGEADKFKSGLPNNLKKHAEDVYDMVRAGMKLNEESSEELEEYAVLDFSQRRKRALVMRRYERKMAAARARLRKRIADNKHLLKRARKKAIDIIRKKVAGERGLEYKDLSPSEKTMIDKRVQKRKNAIGKIAARLLPAVRKAEMQRVALLNRGGQAGTGSQTSSGLREDLDAIFEDYYAGLSKSTAAKRRAHFAKYGQMDDNNPAAYKPAPGDARAETKPSVYTKRYHMMYNSEGKLKFDRRFRAFRHIVKEDVEMESDAELLALIEEITNSISIEEQKSNEGLKNKAEKSGIPYSVLKKVFDRGVAAWRTGHRPGTTPQQWGYARVNSFITGGKTRTTADADLAKGLREGTYIPDPKDAIVDKALSALDRLYKSKGDQRSLGSYAFDIARSYNTGMSGRELEKKYRQTYMKEQSLDEMFAEYISEGVNDPSIFKAVFLAGGPGSGKSFVVGKTALTSLGFKVINSDVLFENALKKAGLKGTPEDIYSEKGQRIRDTAKATTEKQMSMYLNGRLGLVIDGTGKNYEKIEKQASKLKKLGYDVAMIFVNTDLDTAKIRNRMRERSLPDSEVEFMWKEVQNNIGKFQNLFGNNMFIVDNSQDSNFEAAVLGTYRKISSWSKTDPKSPVAKQWISAARGLKEDKMSVKHHLGIGVPFKHQFKDNIKHIDTDMDGDVDTDDFAYTVPDETIGDTELTKKFFKKYADEKKHTRRGVAFEQVLQNLSPLVTPLPDDVDIESEVDDHIEKHATGAITRAHKLKRLRAYHEEHGAGFEGTDKLVKKYKKDTPGESIDEAFENLLELKKPNELTSFRSRVKGISAVDTRDSSWGNSLLDMFGKYGFKLLGSGKYASVFGSEKYPYVIKVFMKDSAYLRWIKFAMDNKNNPYVPKIRGKVIKITPMIYAIRLEKLSPGYLTGKFAEEYRKWSMDNNHKSDDKNIQDILDYFKKNKDLLDIHSENVMMRGDQLVIIDPFYNWFGKKNPGNYTIDPNEVDPSVFGKITEEVLVEEKDVCPILTAAHMKAFEKFVDKLFEKFGIDFEFTKHFRERMSHERNDPCIDMKELAAMIQKIYKKYQGGEKSLNKFVDAEAVIKDIQSNLNMPIAVEYDRENDELVVIAKTIMRKKNFSTPNPIVKV